MAKKRKHQFYCESCRMPCEIYKKGKGHRVLVCPECGIIARNPGFLGKIARGALKSIPGGDIVSEFIPSGKDKTSSTPKSQKIVTDSLDKPNKGERYVKLALGR